MSDGYEPQGYPGTSPLSSHPRQQTTDQPPQATAVAMPAVSAFALPSAALLLRLQSATRARFSFSVTRDQPSLRPAAPPGRTPHLSPHYSRARAPPYEGGRKRDAPGHHWVLVIRPSRASLCLLSTRRRIFCAYRWSLLASIPPIENQVLTSVDGDVHTTKRLVLASFGQPT